MASQAARSSIAPGVILADTYEITGLLGEGGMGAVWAAKHSRLEGKHVAIKVLHPDVAAESESVARFRREAQIASRLGHPNIVEVYDFNSLPDGTEYLILELLKGESLARRLARGPLPVDHVLAVTRQIGSALQAAHSQDIVHRDLKPQNIFLCPSEAGGYVTEVVKVLDFGISKIRGSQTVKTHASSMLGTPQYMAPEQATGDHAAVDGRTDVFALGSMVYEMLSGRPAFSGVSIPEVVFKVVYEPVAPLGEIAPNVPARVVDAVHRALEKNQPDRFQDVSAFVEALTGDPLRTFRGPAVAGIGGDGALPNPGPITPGGVTHPAAFAHTMGTPSGASQIDVATAQTLAPALRTPPPGNPAATASDGMVGGGERGERGGGLDPDTAKSYDESAFAQTMASGDYADVLGEFARHGRPAPGSSDDRPAELAPPAARPSPARWIALVAGAVVVAIAVTVVVMRMSAPGETAAVLTPDAAAAPVAADAAPARDASVNVRQPDASANVRQPDAGASKRPNRPHRPNIDGPPNRPTPPTGPAADKLAAAREDLAEARELLAAGDTERAIRAALRSLGHARTQPARILLTKIYCQKRDLGSARPHFEQVTGRRERAKLSAYCAKYDILLD